jgi:hypothetical protein
MPDLPREDSDGDSSLFDRMTMKLFPARAGVSRSILLA